MKNKMEKNGSFVGHVTISAPEYKNKQIKALFF